MDLHLRHAAPTDDERAAVDALLGPPRSAWDGGERGDLRDAHVAIGGRETREQRHLLLPALQALQSRVGWISETGLDYVCIAARRSARRRVGRRDVLRAALDDAARAARAARLRRHRVSLQGRGRS